MNFLITYRDYGDRGLFSSPKLILIQTYFKVPNLY